MSEDILEPDEIDKDGNRYAFYEKMEAEFDRRFRELEEETVPF